MPVLVLFREKSFNMDIANATNGQHHILLLGYSRIARKRAIPALTASGQVSRLDIATQSAAPLAREEQTLPGTIFDSYENALQKSEAKVVYISLMNSDHAEWAEKSLLQGFHTVIDKPLVTNYADAVRLVALAQQQNLLIAEATVFAYHPQIETARQELQRAGTVASRVTALFSFPPLDPGDFRYQQHFGGGALHDLGPYAISAGTEFFNEHPLRIYCCINNRTDTGVETAFSMTAVYSGGRAMVGHFGFDTEYQNNITIMGSSICLSIDRIFTIPDNFENTFQVRINNQTSVRTVPPADCFKLFFQKVFDTCNHQQFDTFYDRVDAHARSIEMLKNAAKQEYPS